MRGYPLSLHDEGRAVDLFFKTGPFGDIVNITEEHLKFGQKIFDHILSIACDTGIQEIVFNNISWTSGIISEYLSDDQRESIHIGLNKCGAKKWGISFRANNDPIEDTIVEQLLSMSDYLWLILSCLFIIFFLFIALYYNKTKILNLFKIVLRRSSISNNVDDKLVIIQEDQLIFNEKLGEGGFGIVYGGRYIVKEPKVIKYLVAIKVTKKVVSEIKNNEKEMLDEASIMARLHHENVLELIGICVAGGVKIVTPLRPLGSLKKFLQQNKHNLNPNELFLYCYQISSGMAYLVRNQVVHRDLATRNVLMNRRNHVEITDFGLSTVINEDRSFDSINTARLWTAIECLTDLDNAQFKEETDIWSYGVTCWEILTFAQQPYSSISQDSIISKKDLLEFLKKGGRLPKPPNCTILLYKTLLQCWSETPQNRPKFKELLDFFEKYKRKPNHLIKIISPIYSMNQNMDSEHKLNSLLGSDYQFNKLLSQGIHINFKTGKSQTNSYSTEETTNASSSLSTNT